MAALRRRLEEGSALLLVDGLDELTDPTLRAAFCRRLEAIADRYERAPMVVTSRVVGYREMRVRLRGFEHGTLAELTLPDKEAFVRRWCEATELPARRAAAAEELLLALRSSERIGRLAGNPMLLTTLALVKRKVGKLPSRRAKLYEQAVEVLLHWRSDVDLPLDADEALPQLEYLAHEMCRLGVQRLRRDEVLDLLEGMRRAYPNIRPVGRRAPEDFLARLEARTGLVVQVGESRHQGRMTPVYEFRHLTFQEYLAGLALVRGHFPGHDPARSLAERVGSVAGEAVEEPEDDEPEVSENWREALRLAVASANDDEVDPLLRAILRPAAGEDPAVTGRPRAILAALCLADEPNVSQQVAEEVLRGFAGSVREGDGGYGLGSLAERAAVAVKESEWADSLIVDLGREFRTREPGGREGPRRLLTGLLGMHQVTPQDHRASWMSERLRALAGPEDRAVVAALEVSWAAYKRWIEVAPGLGERLIDRLPSNGGMANAAAWALGWLSRQNTPRWDLSPGQRQKLAAHIADRNLDPEAFYWLARTSVLGDSPPHAVMEACLVRLADPYPRAREAAALLLGEVRSIQAFEALVQSLGDADQSVGVAAAEALVFLGDRRAVEPLLAALASGQESVKVAAASALGSLGDHRAVESLLDALAEAQPEVRGAAARALGALGDHQAFEALVQSLGDADQSVGVAAAEALASLGDRRAVDPLLATLASGEKWVKVAAARALGSLGDRRALEALVAALDDGELKVKATAAAALAALGDPRGLTWLRCELKSADAKVREAALEGLTSMAKTDGRDRTLLSRDLDATWPWLDPLEPIPDARIPEAARSLRLPEAEVRSRYEVMAREWGLQLGWEAAADREPPAFGS